MGAAGTTGEQPPAPDDQHTGGEVAGGEVPRAQFALELELAWDCSLQAFMFPPGGRTPSPGRVPCWAGKKTLHPASQWLYPGV